MKFTPYSLELIGICGFILLKLLRLLLPAQIEKNIIFYILEFLFIVITFIGTYKKYDRWEK